MKMTKKEKFLRSVVMKQTKQSEEENYRVIYNLIITHAWIQRLLKQSFPDLESLTTGLFAKLRDKGEPTRYLLSLADDIILEVEEELEKPVEIKKNMKYQTTPGSNVIQFPVRFWFSIDKIEEDE